MRTNGQRYTQTWERLSDAVKRVMVATGLPKADVQEDICRAIEDGEIRFQARLARYITGFRTSTLILKSPAVHVPVGLAPTDFDWESSRPREAWIVSPGIHRIRQGHWYLAWIELRVDDVIRVLCRGRAPTEQAPPASRKSAKPKRSRPARERAERVINELFPRGVPDSAELPNTALFAKVGKKLKELRFYDVSNETILRAAGRRR